MNRIIILRSYSVLGMQQQINILTYMITYTREVSLILIQLKITYEQNQHIEMQQQQITLTENQIYTNT